MIEDNQLPAKTGDAESKLPDDLQQLKNELPRGVKKMLILFPGKIQSNIIAAAEAIYQQMQHSDKKEYIESENIPVIEDYTGSLEDQIRHLDKHLYYERANIQTEGLRLLKDISNSLKELQLLRSLAAKRLEASEESQA